MPSNNPVWVEHWNELEHKHVSQCMSTGVISSQDKVEETVKHKGRGGLPGVHSTTEKKHLQTHEHTQGPKVSIAALTFWHQLGLLSLKASKVSFYVLVCVWVIPFCQGSDVLLECWCRETAWADEVLFPLASRCSWSQWAGPPCCHLKRCTATPYGNTHCPVHWQRE